MADQDLNHTADIIKAALPYVDSKLKGMAELFAKLLDLMGSLKSTAKSDTLAASGLKSTKIDLEGLLNGIRPVCTNKEREIVDKILNIFNIKRMFEMYNNMMSAMNVMQEFGGFNFGDSGTASDTDDITGNFSSSNFESIFKAASTNFENETPNTVDEEKEGEDPSNSFNPFIENNLKEDTPAGSPIHADNPNKTINPMNNKMVDMLKAMIPPEQMSTFENLSMLLNTMSYDDTSKENENKEQIDG